MSLHTRFLVYFPMLFMATFWGLMKVGLPIFPSMPSLLNTSEDTVRFIISLSFIFAGLFPLIWGPLIDKMQMKRFIELVCVVGVVSLVLASIAGNIAFFGVVFVIGSAFVSGMSVCSRAFPVTFLKDAEQIKHALSLTSFGGYSAAFLTPLLSGWVSTWLGWRAVFVIIPIWLVVMFFLVRKLPEQSQSAQALTFKRSLLQMGAHFKNSVFRKTLVVVMCMAAIIQSYYIAVPFWLTPVYHIQPTEVAYYLLPTLLPGIIYPPFSNYMIKKLGERFILNSVKVCFILAALSAFALSLFNNTISWLWLLPGFLATLYSVALIPILLFHTFNTIDEGKSSASGLIGVATYVSGGIGMLITVYINLGNFYWEGVFILVAALISFWALKDVVRT
ncbi:MFS transporter [Vibrio sp. S4M6]|uniref:MFS transporter n=1 Tax=Vibrio sinus TaxID=2946865 RepID=UPI00202A8526|nr:MFS transporter [Vibrio sinus]MCL9781118.1 MFS transporter [Vibrio sinus]